MISSQPDENDYNVLDGDNINFGSEIMDRIKQEKKGDFYLSTFA